MPQQPIITTIDNATSVDWTEYDLTLDAAAKALFDGKNIIAKEFGDYSSELIEEVDPYPDTLEAKYYTGKSLNEIAESLRYYELFGSINPIQK